MFHSMLLSYFICSTFLLRYLHYDFIMTSYLTQIWFLDTITKEPLIHVYKQGLLLYKKTVL